MTRSFAPGAYSASYNTDSAIGPAAGKGEGARSLGLVHDVYWWQRSIMALPLHSNLVAGMPLDAIYTGGECFCRFTVKEWNPAVRAMLWPFDDSQGEIGPVGARLSHYAGELLLTAEEGTLAEEQGPATLRFAHAIVSPESKIDIPLGRVERDVAVVLQCLAYVNAAGDRVWFETE